MSRLTDQMAQSAAWLRRQQMPCGGWPGIPGEPWPSSLNTAEALIALLRTDKESLATDPVKRGLEFLRKEQATDKGDAGAWCRRDGPEGGEPIQHPDVIRTGLVLEAFALAEATLDDHVRLGVEWLVKVQNPDGGWGCARQEATRLLPTCQALLGLMSVAEVGHDRDEPVQRGMSFVVGTWKRDGFFSLNDSADLLASAHTIYAVLVLQTARQPSAGGLAPAIDDPSAIKRAAMERAAIDWLLRNQDDARRLVTEHFNVGDRPYSFLYVTDSLLVRVLTNSKSDKDRAMPK